MQDKINTLRRALGAMALSGALALVAGCHSNAQNTGPDPAAANMAPPNGQTQVLGENASYAPQQQGESYPQQGEYSQQPAPVERAYPDQAQPYQDSGYYPSDTEQAGEEALEESNEAPPPLPEYDQPPAPGPDYIWTPGYWAWGSYGYYWVPGAWVEAPYYGALWTPPYWGYCSRHWCFHHGYWGPHVGYYGGIDYGFGYIGIGYFGGYWNGDHFYYNREVTHIGGGIGGAYVYQRPVIYNSVRYGAQPSNRVSYNGGNGGLTVQPRPTEMAAMRERHDAPMPIQRQALTQASQNRALAFSNNHGRPSQPVVSGGLANSRGIAAPPRGVQPGRTAYAPAGQPQPNAGPNRGGQPQPNAAPNRFDNRADQPQPQPNSAPNRFENRGGQPQPQPNAAPNRFENRGGQPQPQPNAAPNRFENRGGQPQPQPNGAPNRFENRPNQPQPQPQPNAAPNRFENRAQPQPQPQPRVDNRAQPQPQPRMENRPQPQPQPQPRMERPQPQAQPQPRMESRPQPQPQPQRAAPQPRQAPAPAPAPQRQAPAPQQQAPHGGGGGNGGHPQPQGGDHGDHGHR